jgi:hypothetical protein
VYDERFERQYGFFRPYVRQVIYRFLDFMGASNRGEPERTPECQSLGGGQW